VAIADQERGVVNDWLIVVVNKPLDEHTCALTNL